MEIKCHDCRNYSAQEILDYMIVLNPSLRHSLNRRRTYIGASGNVAERLYRHNARNKLLFCALTAHRNVASAVERLAHEMGFCIGNVEWGGSGTNSHSVYVYAYRMTATTVE